MKDKDKLFLVGYVNMKNYSEPTFTEVLKKYGELLQYDDSIL